MTDDPRSNFPTGPQTFGSTAYPLHFSSDGTKKFDYSKHGSQMFQGRDTYGPIDIWYSGSEPYYRTNIFNEASNSYLYVWHTGIATTTFYKFDLIITT